MRTRHVKMELSGFAGALRPELGRQMTFKGPFRRITACRGRRHQLVALLWEHNFIRKIIDILFNNMKKY